jgi:hypothetical protein
MNTQPPTTAPRLRRLLFAAAALVALLAFGRFAWLRLTLEPTPRPEYWAALIEALDPPPENALSPEQAADLLANRPWEAVQVDWDKSPRGSPRGFVNFDASSLLYGPWDKNRPDMAAAIPAFESAEFVAARRKLREALTTGWRPEIDPAPGFTGTGGLSLFRAWAKCLVGHSRWARDHADDIDLAADDWLLTLRLARECRRSGSLTHHLVAVSIEALVTHEMMLTAIEPHGPIDMLTLARQVDEIVGGYRPPADVLEGERLYMHSILEHKFVREGGKWLAVNEAANMQIRGGGQASRFWNLASPLFNNLDTARKNLDAEFAEVDSQKNLVLLHQSEERGEWRRPHHTVLDGDPQQFPSFYQVLMLYYQAAAHLEGAVAMLALAEYHRRHGRYPESLDNLIPDFLPRLPLDYADLQPLRYHRTDDGYLLYSVGLDGVDDGGKTTIEEHPATFRRGPPGGGGYETNADVVFSRIRRAKPWWEKE